LDELPHQTNMASLAAKKKNLKSNSTTANSNGPATLLRNLFQWKLGIAIMWKPAHMKLNYLYNVAYTPASADPIACK